MRNYTKFLSSFYLLIIGGFIINSQHFIGDHCFGLGEMLNIAYLFFLYLISFIVIFLLNSIKSNWKWKAFNFYPIFTTIFIIFLCLTGWIIESGKLNGKKILTAELYQLYDHIGPSHLDLFSNNTFLISENDFEFTCHYTGKYSIKNDTLILFKDIHSLAGSDFSNKYLIDKANLKLYPIDKPDGQTDQSRWLILGDKHR